MKHERISLPIDTPRLVAAVTWPVVGWLFFLLIIQSLGLIQLPEALQVLTNTPAWKIWAQILSTWLFVGMGEEVLFRGYFLNAFWRHFTRESDPQRMVKAVLWSSMFFSLWHLPIRVFWLVTGELDVVTLLLSLVVLFLLGIGYAYLFLRSDNILLAGLVHGLSDFPLIGKDTQMAPIILVVAIVCVEIARATMKRRA